MYTVNDIAKQVNINPHTIRYYVKSELLHPQRNQDNDYQLFSQHDLQHLRFILRAKSLGCTLNEIKYILTMANSGSTACPTVRKIVQKRLLETQQKITELQQIKTRVEHALQNWENMPDAAPSSHSICHLIESMS